MGRHANRGLNGAVIPHQRCLWPRGALCCGGERLERKGAAAGRPRESSAPEKHLCTGTRLGVWPAGRLLATRGVRNVARCSEHCMTVWGARLRWHGTDTDCIK